MEKVLQLVVPSLGRTVVVWGLIVKTMCPVSAWLQVLQLQMRWDWGIKVTANRQVVEREARCSAGGCSSKEACWTQQVW